MQTAACSLHRVRSLLSTYTDARVYMPVFVCDRQSDALESTRDNIRGEGSSLMANKPGPDKSSLAYSPILIFSHSHCFSSFGLARSAFLDFRLSLFRPLNIHFVWPSSQFSFIRFGSNRPSGCSVVFPSIPPSSTLVARTLLTLANSVLVSCCSLMGFFDLVFLFARHMLIIWNNLGFWYYTVQWSKQ